MDGDTFLTIGAAAQAKLVEKKSVFLSFVHPIGTADDAEDLLRQYRKKYYDARHICYAYVLGEPSDAKSSDNGEPSGTAGRPILGVLLAHNLRYVCCIVVRYFGGIKLGTSGLADAYQISADMAYENTVVVEKKEEILVEVGFDYFQMNSVMTTIKSLNLKVLESNFDNKCVLKMMVPKSTMQRLQFQLSKIVNHMDIL